MRKAHPALRRGSYQPLYAADGVYAFGRKLDAETLVIALNAAEETRTIDIAVETLNLADGSLTAIFGRTQASVQDGKINNLRLAPRSAVVLERK